MDITQQKKLTKEEWESVEVPVSESEKQVLQLIMDGYFDVNIKHNNNKSLLGYAKIQKTEMIEIYFYKNFFKQVVLDMVKASKITEPTIMNFDKTVKEVKADKIKTADTIRIKNITEHIESMRSNIIEYIFLDFVKEMLTLFQAEKKKYAYYLYTLIQLRNINVDNINAHVLNFIDICVEFVKSKTGLSNIIYNSYDFIEKNPNIYKYGDIALYDHQKRLFNLLRNDSYIRDSNLVLYIAPTGTGKTLSPIGLLPHYRVIFVCAARHIGLALAKSAISAQKCVAFAFGCDTASDIRLHNYAASVYKINKKTGGIGKIDNLVGNKVELMICDAKSYLVAMYYMLTFNSEQRMITYWDEPTIGLDCPEHALHDIIHQNWADNKIPNIVLSSATLPSEEELMPVIMNFRSRFYKPVSTTIQSHDFNKSIPIINKMGYSVCPHNMFEKFIDLQKCVMHCNENLTLLRYFDLKEIMNFIELLTDRNLIPECYIPEAYFDNNIANIKMNSIKTYYLDLLSRISEEDWQSLYKYINSNRTRKFDKTAKSVFKKSTSLNSAANNMSANGKEITRTQSVSVSEPSFVDKAKTTSVSSGGILLTTADAHTLTDGPTIYLSENIKTVSNFYIQQSNIPKIVFDELIRKININNDILEKARKLEAKLEDQLGEIELKEKSDMSADQLTNNVAERIDAEIRSLKEQMKPLSLDSVYVPNTNQHQDIWVSEIVSNAFVPTIDAETTKRVMELFIDDRLKLLLLLGIGSFEYHEDTTYTEIVKEMAYKKQLFIIIASSDYIYGTNYNFCHGIIGKDLLNMTQQKTIQTLGRVGRNNIQQEYTARFRDDDIIYNLFMKQTSNIEAENMCRLLVSDDE